MRRTDFAVLATHRAAERMGARFSAPAERVEVEHDLTTMRFSRTLDEHHPYERSSTAWIVPMDPAESWAQHIKYLYVGALLACAVLYLVLN